MKKMLGAILALVLFPFLLRNSLLQVTLEVTL